ncbi:MAG: GIY-YIG nuclease family protein [Candidatus Omnitrophota bacterium]|jgi:hypothetical protein
MNKCLKCGAETKNNKFCSISCQNSFQSEERNNKRFGVFKSFAVKCHKCGKEFIVNEREKLFPQKEIYYCSKSCANSRIISQETKDKIRKGVNNFLVSFPRVKTIKESKTLKKINPPKMVKLICKNCGKEFEVSYCKRDQQFCCRSCVTKWRNTNLGLAKNAGLKSGNNKTNINFLIKSCDNKILNKKTFIYSLEYPIGNIRYIGKSDNPKERLKKHIKEAKYRNKNHKDKWINSLSEPPILNVIEETTYEHWQVREMYWINFYKEKGFNLVNGTDGGEGSNGYFGRSHSQETKDKLSKLATGKIPSQETINKISGENNSRCKIKDDEVRKIFCLYYEQKLSYKKIAEIYNLTGEYIHQLIHGKNRKNIFEEYNSLNIR